MRIEDIKFDHNGLIPAVAQDVRTGEVLMLAYVNRESLQRTMDTGFAHYYSRSRQKLWFKGETSGHTQKVYEIVLDCDADAILLKIDQEGVACHTGEMSCFHQSLYGEDTKIAASVLQDVYDVIADRKINPKSGSYTNYLLDKGLDKILKKVGEEASEVIIAGKNQQPQELRYEVADLIYHVMVLMSQQGMSWQEIFEELRSRQ